LNSDEKKFYELGASSIDITPQPGVSLYTLDGVARNSNELHSELKVNTITIGTQKELLIIVSLDLIWIDRSFTKKVQKWINLSYEDYDAHVLLTATHSHSTPQISKKILNSARPDKLYLEFLFSQVCQSIKKAFDNKEQCHAKLSITNPNLTVNRRKKILSPKLLKRGIFKSVIANRPNYKGSCDGSLYNLWFYDKKGKEKAVLLNYACHPSLFRDKAVSADFPGVASDHLREQLSEDLVVCFLQGFSGNIKANITKSSYINFNGVANFFFSFLFDRVHFNKNISSEQLNNFSITLAKSALRRDNEKYINPRLFFSSENIQLPLQDNEDNKFIDLEVFYFSVGDNLRGVAIGGEVFNEYSSWIRALPFLDGVDLLTLGYCNDMIGYIPTYEAINEGGYEVERALKEFSLTAPFSDKIESLIKKKIEKLIKSSLI
jgi:uncharacterized protein YajQ (UPF0234 family)